MYYHTSVVIPPDITPTPTSFTTQECIAMANSVVVWIENLKVFKDTIVHNTKHHAALQGSN